MLIVNESITASEAGVSAVRRGTWHRNQTERIWMLLPQSPATTGEGSDELAVSATGYVYSR